MEEEEITNAMQNILFSQNTLIEKLIDRVTQWNNNAKVSDLLLEIDFGEIYWPYLRNLNIIFLKTITSMKKNPNFEKEYQVKTLFFPILFNLFFYAF